MPSGKIIKVQGYEPFALNYLLALYKEEDIVTNRKDTPEFWYYTTDLKKHRYYPDIYIKSVNMVIEIKSTWTNIKHIEVDELKKQCVIKNGYKYKKLIFDSKGVILNKEESI